MSRCLLVIATLASSAISGTLAAQETEDEPVERIDILVPPAVAEEEASSAEAARQCEEDDLAGTISGEIVVCRRTGSETDGVFDKEDWERRYAARTKGMSTPDLFGIPAHGTVVSRGCFIPPCPPPPAYFIDFDSLPDAPPGSDADRIARGLAPRGRDTGASGEETAQPAPPDSASAEVNREESEAAAEEP